MDEPMWIKLYRKPEWYELVRLVGYFGCTVKELFQFYEDLVEKGFDRRKIETASYHTVTFEGQMTLNPKKDAKVELRSDVRKVSHQLLGPSPDTWDTFYRFSDGRPRPEHAAKMALLAKHRKPEPKRPRRKTG